MDLGDRSTVCTGEPEHLDTGAALDMPFISECVNCHAMSKLWQTKDTFTGSTNAARCICSRWCSTAAYPRLSKQGIGVPVAGYVE